MPATSPTATTLAVTDWTPCNRIRPGPGVFTAVGDVHGERDCLDAILSSLPDDSDVTLLGDLGDRGPDSPGAFRCAAEHGGRFRRFEFLPGNHDVMLLATHQDPYCEMGGMLFMNGGQWALDMTDIDNTPALIERLLGPAAFAMLRGPSDVPLARRAMHRQVGNVVLVHAGLLPGLDPSDHVAGFELFGSSDWHPLWIRDRFLDHWDSFGKPGQDLFVVHGHTMEHTTIRQDGTRAEPGTHVHDGWRLGIDGGSFKTGIVTATQFRDGAYRIITATRQGGRRIAMD